MFLEKKQEHKENLFKFFETSKFCFLNGHPTTGIRVSFLISIKPLTKAGMMVFSLS